MSDLSDAIRRARRRIGQDEAPITRALIDVYRRAVDEMTADLNAVTRLITDARAAGVDVSPDWLRRQDRYRTLIAQAEREFARFAGDGMRILDAGRARAISGGAAEAWELAEAAGVRTGFGSRINTRAVERFTAALSDDSPLRDVLDRYGDHAAEVIERRLSQGIVQGTGPREVIRGIRRELNSPTNRARLSTLVRTEMMRAYRGSLFDQYRAMGLDQWRWTASHGTRTCLACLSRSGRVYSMKYPFMPSHANCFVAGTVVNGPAVVSSSKRWYAGEVVDVRFASGDLLTVTPNHPILTPQGWVAAGALMEGRDVLRCDSPQGPASTINPDHDHRPAFIEDVAESFGGAVPMIAVTVPTTPVDFHGDGAGSEVSIIRTDCLLGHALQSRVVEPALQDQLGWAGMGLPLFSGAGGLDTLVHGALAPAHGIMGGGGEALAFSGAGLRHTCVHGGGAASDGYASLFQVSPDDESLSAVALSESFLRFPGDIPVGNLGNWQLDRGEVPDLDTVISEDTTDAFGAASVEPGQLLDGLSGTVSTDHVVSVDRRGFTGHVYNLQTSEGWYIANNIITHNCRCVPTPVSEYVKPESGPEWFARQDETTRRKMMPSAAVADAYERGDVALSDFVGHKESKVWGRSIYQRSGREAIAHAGR